MGAALRKVSQLESEAREIALPGGHLLQFGHHGLKKRVEAFIQTLYDLNVPELSIEGLERVEYALDLVILALDWVAKEEKWENHRSYYEAAARRVRQSLDLISQGFSADPSKTPSSEELDQIDRAAARDALKAIKG